VLDTLIPKEVEVQSLNGLWYLLRILPYRTLENVIEGAVITFVDITMIRQLKEALRESEGLCRLAVVVRDSNDAILIQSLSGQIHAWNPGAERLYGWSESEALQMNIKEMIPEDHRKEALEIIHRLARAEILEPFRTQRIAKNHRIIDVSVTVTALVNENGDPYAVATTEKEITK